MDWGNRQVNHEKIPSEISYSATSSNCEEQWGADFSPDAIIFKDLKADLQAQESEHKPRHSRNPYENYCLSPEDVLRDYMEKI
jgi:hypothetical protein